VHSLERHLLGWVLAALGLGAAVLVLAMYFVVLDELNAVFDESLKQVALAAATHEDAASLEQAHAALPGLPIRYEGLSDFAFVTAVYDRKGALLFSSDPSARLPFTRVTGLSYDDEGKQAWHIYTIVQGDRVVQAGQRGESRRSLALESATKLLVAVSALTALIGVLVVVALRRGLRPLDSAAGEIAARDAASLEPIARAGTPREIHPMIDAINDLLRRLNDAFGTQRRFVADAAHELRSPIAALRLQLHLLQGSSDAAEREGFTAELRLGIERAERLVAQLLDLSRADPDAPSRPRVDVALGVLVERIVARWTAQAAMKGIALSARVEPGLHTKADEHQLDVMLDNLVDNAIRYTPARGHVEVSACRLESRPALRVVDDGPGIAPAERERVFDRFYRGEGLSGEMRASGSGLGLAIVRAIALRHGCEVALTTPPSGIGLEVHINFRA